MCDCNGLLGFMPFYFHPDIQWFWSITHFLSSREKCERRGQERRESVTHNKMPQSNKQGNYQKTPGKKAYARLSCKACVMCGKVPLLGWETMARSVPPYCARAWL